MPLLSVNSAVPPFFLPLAPLLTHLTHLTHLTPSSTRPGFQGVRRGELEFGAVQHRQTVAFQGPASDALLIIMVTVTDRMGESAYSSLLLGSQSTRVGDLLAGVEDIQG